MEKIAQLLSLLESETRNGRIRYFDLSACPSSTHDGLFFAVALFKSEDKFFHLGFHSGDEASVKKQMLDFIEKG